MAFIFGLQRQPKLSSIVAVEPNHLALLLVVERVSLAVAVADDAEALALVDRLDHVVHCSALLAGEAVGLFADGGDGGELAEAASFGLGEHGGKSFPSIRRSGRQGRLISSRFMRVNWIFRIF